MVSAVIATRVSPSVFSLGTASLMCPFAAGCVVHDERGPSNVAPPRWTRTRAAPGHKPIAGNQSGDFVRTTGASTPRTENDSMDSRAQRNHKNEN